MLFWEQAVYGAPKLYFFSSVRRILEPYAGGRVPILRMTFPRTHGMRSAKISYVNLGLVFRILEVSFERQRSNLANSKPLGTIRNVISNSFEQNIVAEQLIGDLTRENVYAHPIVSVLEPLTSFYPAETYHQDFFLKHPREPYCQVVIAPKIAKLRKTFVSKLKLP